MDTIHSEYIRVAAVTPPVAIGDCDHNIRHIVRLAADAARRGAQVILFPELSVTAYTCADLFMHNRIIQQASDAVAQMLHDTADIDAVIVVGAPVMRAGALYNCAIATQCGRILAVVPKTYLPAYNEFYEKRWWRSGAHLTGTVDYAGCTGIPFGTDIILQTPKGVGIGIEICEDLWAPLPPSTYMAMAGAQLLLNLSASDDIIGKYDYLRALVASQSARCLAAYVYASAGFGESSTDLVFDGKTIIAENGTILQQSERWSGDPRVCMHDIDISALNHDRIVNNTYDDCRVYTQCHPFRVIRTSDTVASAADYTALMRHVDPHPFVPAHDIDTRAHEIISIQAAGLAQRLHVTHTASLVVGISGGLDSTLALLVATHAFDRLGLPRTGITAVTMPGFGTTGRTYNNAIALMRQLGVTIREINIAAAVTQHFSDIGHDPADHDITYENSQARERTQILMDIANQTRGMVLGTGDMSELALGWATYNGDHMSMYGVNVGVPKTLVRHLVAWFRNTTDDQSLADTLTDIIDTPISPELIPADEHDNITQKTEDLVGPYELHDFFLYHLMRYGRTANAIRRLASIAFAGVYDDDTITHWLNTFMRRFYTQQFKRSCMPDGPKVGSICLSPRGDLRMPSDATPPRPL